MDWAGQGLAGQLLALQGVKAWAGRSGGSGLGSSDAVSLDAHDWNPP